MAKEIKVSEQKLYNQALKVIQEHEGLELKPYIDPLVKKTIPKEDLLIITKYWYNLNITIGYGRNLQTNPMTQNEAIHFLLRDIKTIRKDLGLYLGFFEDLNNSRKVVLISMAYQMGLNGLNKFKNMLLALHNEDYNLASLEMLDSLWFKQTPQRALDLANLMKGDN